jgi:hypothetical protein
MPTLGDIIISRVNSDWTSELMPERSECQNRWSACSAQGVTLRSSGSPPFGRCVWRSLAREVIAKSADYLTLIEDLFADQGCWLVGDRKTVISEAQANRTNFVMVWAVISNTSVPLTWNPFDEIMNKSSGKLWMPSCRRVWKLLFSERLLWDWVLPYYHISENCFRDLQSFNSLPLRVSRSNTEIMIFQS